MREYSSREEAERDPDLDLKIVWQCDRCHRVREDYPGWNEGGTCMCRGSWIKLGESYR